MLNFINYFFTVFRCIPGELFLWTLWSTFRCTLSIGNKPGIYGLCIPVDSFALRCESVTCNYVFGMYWAKGIIICISNNVEKLHIAIMCTATYAGG